MPGFISCKHNPFPALPSTISCKISTQGCQKQAIQLVYCVWRHGLIYMRCTTTSLSLAYKYSTENEQYTEQQQITMDMSGKLERTYETLMVPISFEHIHSFTWVVSSSSWAASWVSSARANMHATTTVKHIKFRSD